MKYNFKERQFTETDVNTAKIAIAGSDADIDWGMLHDKVEALCNVFKKLNIPEGHPVIIYGHKEAAFPLVILACIHSKTTYIPIDKIYPVDRIRKIIEITGSQVLINCSADKLDVNIAITFNAALEPIINFTPDYTGRIYGNASDMLQYIMFTSGSTGEPKGVQITYSSILTFLNWAIDDFGFSEDDVFLNQAPFTFDVSLCDILNAFYHGATLVLSPTDIIKDQDAFFTRLLKYKCSVWTSTPSFAYLFLRHPNFNASYLSSINTFLFMGEDLPNRTCSIIKHIFKDARILNAYGPTEATIVTTSVEITDKILKQYHLLPIGYPMPESKILIAKENPTDKEGELIIVGNHVSVGYFKNEASNKEKFFIHEGQRAFRTGDLAYYENDMVFCIGRNDDQVKMHGFRIELNEISNVLCKSHLINDATTVALKRNNEVKKIISFVILKNPLTKEELNLQLIPFLEKTVPYYMIPGDIVIVNAFPYNTSHKIDKNKLIENYLN